MPLVGEIAGLATAVCWSFTSIFFSAAGRRIGALQVNLYRLPAAILLLGVSYLLVADKLHMPVNAALWLAASGVVGLAIGDTFLFKALVEIGARLSMVLMSLAPPFAALLGYLLLGESLNLYGILGIIVTITGVTWVVAERTPDRTASKTRTSLIGIVWGILAALGQAAGLILSKKGVVQDIHILLATLVRMVGATIVIWPLTILTRRVRSPRLLFSKDTTALKYMLGGILFGPFLGVTLSLMSVKYTATGIAATLMATVPVIMIPMVILIEKERPTWRAVLGAIIAVTGVAILFLR